MIDILVDWYETKTNVIIGRKPGGVFIAHTTEDNITLTLPELITNIFTLYQAIQACNKGAV